MFTLFTWVLGDEWDMLLLWCKTEWLPSAFLSCKGKRANGHCADDMIACRHHTDRHKVVCGVRAAADAESAGAAAAAGGRPLPAAPAAQVTEHTSSSRMALVHVSLADFRPNFMLLGKTSAHSSERIVKLHLPTKKDPRKFWDSWNSIQI
jgi:hypothetical protein